MDRRGFLKSAALVGAATLIPGSANAVFGGLERALHEPIALGRVQARRDQLEMLTTTFDLAEHARDGWYDIVLRPGDRARLRAEGFETEIIVDDLLAQAENPTTRMTYRTYADYVADLQRLATDHASLVRLIELPNRTHEGRQIFAVEIAAGDGADGRPGVYFDGVHHAREWPSGELPMMFAEDLVHSYVAGDQRIRALLTSTRIFIVPIVNPDGFVRSRETISDFIAPLPGAAATAGELAYQRKNMRKNTSLPAEPGQGVDPNRNYPFHWGGNGAARASNDQTYRGPAAGSEPESRNVMWLLRAHQVQTMITNHTYGNLVLRPWGDTSVHAPDETALRALGDAMATLNGYTSQKGIDLYPTTGTTEDWFYGVTGGLAYTFEHGSTGATGLGNVGPHEGAGFHPQYNLNIPAFYARNRTPFLLLAEAALDPQQHATIQGTAPAGSILTLRKSVFVEYAVGGILVMKSRGYTEEHAFTLTVPASGAYEWHVNPSPIPETVDRVQRGVLPASALEPYTLTCVSPGAPISVRSFVVHRGTRTVANF